MTKGFYRFYFHIGDIGFKIAKFNIKNGNPFIGFIISCVMNILEWKRYRYYCKGKSYRQWGRKWKYNSDGLTPIFCPTYFSCGLFSIVKHLPKEVTYEEMLKLAKEFVKDKDLKDYQKIDCFFNKFTLFLIQSDINPKNFRKDKNGNLYCIDYGDFYCGNLSRNCVALIDYE